MGNKEVKETFKWYDNRNKNLVIRASIVAALGLIPREILSGLNQYLYDYKLIGEVWYDTATMILMYVFLIGLAYGIAVFQTDRYYKRLAEQSESKVTKNE